MEKQHLAYTLNNVYIVIPLYNEELVLTEVILELKKSFANILVVDDGSNDTSNQLLQSLDVTLITHAINLGQGAAIKTAFDYMCTIKNAFAVVTFDADGQHSAMDAIKFANEIIRSKEDVIFGTRFVINDNGVPVLKRIVLKFATRVTNFLTGLKLTDTHNGLKALKVSAIKELNLDVSGYAFESQLAAQISKQKITYKEMPTDISYTEYSMKKGQSLRNCLIIVEDLLNLGRSK